jgi:hypothetical protein
MNVNAATGFRAAVLLTVVAVLSAGCGGSGNGSGGGASKARTGSADATVQRFGYAPSGNAKLQRDVVVVRGGASAIRSASSDGLNWTIDRNADGAAKLKVGSIMFATSRVVGRVAAMHDDGDNRIVTLAPVLLTDVLRDGTIAIDQNFDVGSVAFQLVPDYPGAESPHAASNSTATSDHVVRVPPISLVAFRGGARPARDLPTPSHTSVKATISGFEIEPYFEAGKVGVNISRGDENGLKVAIDLAFPFSNFHINTSTSVSNGSVSRSNFLVEGLRGLDVSLQAGSRHGSLDNEKLKVQVPISIDIPIAPSPATAGLPLDIQVTFSVVIETALAGSNATVLGAGSYKLNGPFGVSDGKVVGPKFTVDKSLIDSLTGISLGPSGLVAALNAKVLLGIGTPALAAGPYGQITASVGVTNGSALGASLVRCKGENLYVSVGGGIGLSLAQSVLDALKNLLPKDTQFPTTSDAKTLQVASREKVVPEVKACKA